MHHLKDHLPTAGLTPGLGINLADKEGMVSEEMILSQVPPQARSAIRKLLTALNKLFDQIAPKTSRLTIQLIRHSKGESQAAGRVIVTSILSLLFAGYIFASLATLGLLGKTAMTFVASFLPVVVPALSVIAAILFALICVGLLAEIVRSYGDAGKWITFFAFVGLVVTSIIYAPTLLAALPFATLGFAGLATLFVAASLAASYALDTIIPGFSQRIGDIEIIRYKGDRSRNIIAQAFGYHNENNSWVYPFSFLVQFALNPIRWVTSLIEIVRLPLQRLIESGVLYFKPIEAVFQFVHDILNLITSELILRALPIFEIPYLIIENTVKFLGAVLRNLAVSVGLVSDNSYMNGDPSSYGAQWGSRGSNKFDPSTIMIELDSTMNSAMNDALRQMRY